MGDIILRPPGKTGLTFDVILSRLKVEVQKSRVMGAELRGLMERWARWAMFLWGPANLPPFPMYLPSDITQPPLPPSQPAAAPTAAGSSGMGSPTVPVVVPASVLMEVAAKEKAKDGAIEGAGSSTSLPPAVTTSECEQATSATSSSAPAATVSASTQLTTTASASSNYNAVHAPALPVGIIQDLHPQLREAQVQLVGHLERVRQLEGVMLDQEAMGKEEGVLREVGAGGGQRAGELGAGHERKREHAREHEQQHRYEHDLLFFSIRLLAHRARHIHHIDLDHPTVYSNGLQPQSRNTPRIVLQTEWVKPGQDVI
ncbi:hypothetical protein CVT25_002014 [Psilocybe cyanescens]|uniref:Uncharacterized protein n=1 Tax=Psilocybe cyanescens TaxID=93625 RepID=A0A409XWE1_PSICY|nr:hypothetical protein CVT25_002014 [Psilocybe cyanescens]